MYVYIVFIFALNVRYVTYIFGTFILYVFYFFRRHYLIYQSDAKYKINMYNNSIAPELKYGENVSENLYIIFLFW